MSALTVVAEPIGSGGPAVRHAVLLQRLAAVLAVTAVAEDLAILLISAVGDQRFEIGADLATIGFLASVLLFPVMGALIIQRRPATRVAWLMIVIGLGFGLSLVIFGYGAVGMPPAQPLPGAALALVASQLFFVPIPGAAIAILVLLFPSDRLLSPRWRLASIMAVVGGVLYAIGIALGDGAVDTAAFPAFENPIEAPATWTGLLEILSIAGNTLVIGAIALGALSLVVRYQRADMIESAQIKWIALVAGIAAVTFAIAALQISQGPLAGISDAAFGIGLVVLSAMPIAIGIAISRYRLYDIDRLINRALVYGSLTAILAGVFTAAIGLAQRVFVAATGETSDAAIVLTTLVVATLYAPLRKRLEVIIDRRFKYDVRRFGAYRSEVEQLLSIMDPARAAARLVSDAVAELDATGGAVVDADGVVVATSGVWPIPTLVRLPIPGRSRSLAALVLGPRQNGQPYDPRTISELDELVTLVAGALRLQDTPGDTRTSRSGG
ncbi:MAG TPA: hypothetical protein VFW02_08940 [Candidatus Limnocylindrales bacterium]|nr:hypothetical protein [Candidatus Limnocylindrales bacterium]